MRSRIVPAALLACGAALALWLAWLGTAGVIGYRAPRLDPTLASATGYAWRGAVHVHTELSADATGTVGEIAAAARRVGLDFVVLSDHTGARGTAGRAVPGWYGSVLVLVGEEISTRDGHLLALAVSAHPYALGPQARQALEDIRVLGGASWVAHPGGDPAWTAGLGGVAGIEVVSLSGALDRLSMAQRLRATLAYPASPSAAGLRVLSARPPALDLWSARTSLSGASLPRPLVAIGSVDAHGPVRGLGVPSYDIALGTVTTLVWMDEPPLPGVADRAVAGRLVRRLQSGRVAIELSAAGRAPGTSFVATGSDGSNVLPGETRSWGDGRWTLEARLGAPGDYTVLLLRDGEVVGRAEGTGLELEAPAPGTYRIEVYRTTGPPGGGQPGATPWIISNPIYLWPAAAITAARVYPAPRLPAPQTARPLLPEPGWAAESDALSASAMAPMVDGLLWNVRVPSEAAADAFSAVAWRPEAAQDWSRTLGLTAGLSSEREWRVSMRVWTASENGEQTWELIVASSPEATPTLSPWRRFRRIGADGQMVRGELLDEELAQVTGVAFVATPQRMRPGSQVQIEIREVGVFGG
ncbi:MAG TPA: hypothetical protein QGG47_03735 [Acidobacteriota bacterium]|nr:hypothetical protein [Acidobacteriota bacterium]